MGRTSSPIGVLMFIQRVGLAPFVHRFLHQVGHSQSTTTTRTLHTRQRVNMATNKTNKRLKMSNQLGDVTTTTASSTSSTDTPPSAPAAAPSTPLIVISGGGLGGAALAVACQLRGLACVVYERDRSFLTRAQGYGLTMQQGRQALAQLKVEVEGINSKSHLAFTEEGKLLGSYGRALREVSTNANHHTNNPEQESTDANTEPDSTSASSTKPCKRKPQHHNIHLPRQCLRSAILDKVKPDTFRWGVSVESYELDQGDEHASDSTATVTTSSSTPESSISSTSTDPSTSLSSSSGTPSRGLRVHLSDGTTVRCAVLVGADGFRSGIRAAKIGDPMRFLGVIVILGFTYIRHPLVNRRVVQTCDGHTRMYFMPFDQYKPKTTNSSSVDASSTTAATHMSDYNVSTSSTSSSSTTSKSKEVDCLQLVNETNAADGSAAGTDCRTMWQLSFPVDEATALRLQAGGGAALKAEALRRCGTWHAPIPDMLTLTNEADITGYPAYDREIPSLEVLRYGTTVANEMKTASSITSSNSLQPHTAASTSSSSSASTNGTPSLDLFQDRGLHSRVTLIGDAAHPMSPFKGQGANQALLDATALAQALHASELGANSTVPRLDLSSSNQSTSVGQKRHRYRDRFKPRPTLFAALAQFESEMLTRSTTKVLESRRNVDFLHSPAVLTEGNHTRAYVVAQAVAHTKEQEK